MKKRTKGAAISKMLGVSKARGMGAVIKADLWLFSAGAFLFGLFSGFAQLYRFAATDVAAALRQDLVLDVRSRDAGVDVELGRPLDVEDVPVAAVHVDDERRDLEVLRRDPLLGVADGLRQLVAAESCHQDRETLLSRPSLAPSGDISPARALPGRVVTS